jgi:hypothetical protein
MAKPLNQMPILTGKNAISYAQLMKEAEAKRIAGSGSNHAKANAERPKSDHK